MKRTLRTKSKNMKISLMKKLTFAALIIAAAFFAALIIAGFKKMPPKVGNKIYSDSANLYKVKLPGDWKTSETNGQNTTGIGTQHRNSQKLEITQLYGPDGTGVTIQVYLGQPDCSQVKKPTTTFAGLPASFDPEIKLWSVATTNALYVINLYYPSINVFHGDLKSRAPTLPPQEIINSDKQLAESVAATFRINNPQALNCP